MNENRPLVRCKNCKHESGIGFDAWCSLGLKRHDINNAIYCDAFKKWDYDNSNEYKKIVDRLNEQEEIIQQLKWSNKILRANRKDCEFGRRNERKNWEKLDKMRIEYIRFLQKRLKENGLSIYINGDVE